ncbi:MAG: S8 family serine peptidase [Bacteriovoracaceae bacterium]|nr:S8 family serine peptidase [Bacteriovoracaceae bacterium]
MNCLKIQSLIFVMIFGFEVFGVDFDDTLFDKQWGLKNTGQPIYRRSNDLTKSELIGSPGVDINWLSIKDSALAKEIPSEREIVVAVLDSGLDIEHPDLKDRIFYDKAYCPVGADNSQKACSGINILKMNENLTDDTGHGTHVAGIIAAVANNRQGVVGLADARIKILPVKVLSNEIKEFVYERRLITDIFADGIVYAIERGADVINMSIGWPKVVESQKIKRALEYAAERNVVVIAAAGNNNKEIPTFPCTNESVICVGAVDNQGKITEFSNFGGKVDLLAPGEFIVSTYPRETVESRILRIRGYESKNGTSQASPFVAGIAASLKLLNPNMSVNEVKARLFSSARNMKDSIYTGKFSKYGMIDMKKALLEKTEKFAMPIYKNLLDLNFDAKTKTFNFKLPVKSLMGEFENLKVTTTFERDDLVLENSIQEISLVSGEKKDLLFKGELKDLSKDTHFRLKVKMESSDFSSVTETTLIFARDMAKEDFLLKEKIEGFKADDLTFFRGPRKVVRMKLVDNKEEWSESPQYFIEAPSLQTADMSVLSLLSRAKGKWAREDISIDKKAEIISVRLSDLNGDGKGDYLITAIDETQTFITFDYLINGDSVEKNHLTFKFPLLEYSNFPIEYNQLGDTPLLAMDFSNHSLKVPAFFATYTLPEADNTQDILDRVPETLRSNHVYYLRPYTKGDELYFELRTIDSYERVQSIRNEHQVEPWLPMSFEKPFPQSINDLRAGTLKGLVSKGEEYDLHYYFYVVNKTDVSLSPVFFSEQYVSENTVRPLLSVANNSQGSPLGSVEFLAQLNRSQVRSYVWDPLTKEGKLLLLDSSNWGDPIFNTISAYDDSEGTRFIETRYFLRYFTNDGSSKKLRINRESSFPGVRFSETLNPIVVSGDEENYPGIFINSTLIFGNRLYSMVKKEQSFVRPLLFSVDIPENCVHLKPERVEGVFNYLLLCRGNGGGIEVQRLPLKL